MVKRAPQTGNDPVQVEDMLKNAGRAVLHSTLSLILAASLVPAQATTAIAEELGAIAAQEHEHEAESNGDEAPATEPIDNMGDAEGEPTGDEVESGMDGNTDEPAIAEDEPTVEVDEPAEPISTEEESPEVVQGEEVVGAQVESEKRSSVNETSEIVTVEQTVEVQAPTRAGDPVTYSFKSEETPDDASTNTFKDRRTVVLEVADDVDVSGTQLKAAYVDIEGKVHDQMTGENAALILSGSDLSWSGKRAEVSLTVEGMYYSFQLLDASGNAIGAGIGLVQTGEGEKVFSVDAASPTLVDVTLPAETASSWTLVARDMTLDAENSVVTIDGTAVTPTAGGNFDTNYTMNLSEGEHEVAVSLVDKVGHDAFTATYTFTITDNEEPYADVDYSEPVAATVDGVKYYTSDDSTINYVTAAITITDKSFDPTKVTIETTGIPGEWGGGASADEHVCYVTFENGEHSLKVSGTDAGGLPFATYNSGLFVVDTIDPNVGVTITKNTANSKEYEVTVSDPNLRTDTTKVFGISLDTLASGSTAGDDGLSTYTKTQRHKSGKTGVMTIKWKLEDGAYRFTVSLKNYNFKGSFVEAYDKATNQNVWTQSDVTSDSEAPDVLSATVSSEAITSAQNVVNETGTVLFFNEDTNGETIVTLQVWDLTGVNEDKVTLYDPNNTYAITGVTSEPSSDYGYDTTITITKLVEDAPFSSDILISIPDKAVSGVSGVPNTRVWSLSEKGRVTSHTQDGESQETEDDNTSLTYGEGHDAEDYGHPKRLIEDHTAPVLSMSIVTEDGETVEAGNYYPSVATVSLSVDELSMPYLYANSPSSHSLLTILKKGSSKKTYTVADIDQSTGLLTVKLDGADYGDGDYTIGASLTDLAGNTGVASLGEFTIDTTAPVFTVDYGQDDANHAHKSSDVTYFDAGRTATITVEEHNFNEETFYVVPTHTGWVAKEPVVSEWTHDGDTHTCTVTFAEGGNYSLSVYGEDRAGNDGILKDSDNVTVYDSGLFVVDLTSPTISVTKDGKDFDAVIDAQKTKYDGDSYFNENQTITVTLTDRNLDLANSVVLIDQKPVVAGDWSKSKGDDDVVTYTYTYTYTETPDKSGGSEGKSYTPKIQLVDLATNNASRADKTFVIDKTAPSVDNVSVKTSVASEGSDKASENDPIRFYNKDTTIVFDVSDAHRIKSIELFDPQDGFYTGSSDVKAGSFSGTHRVDLADGASNSKDTEYERDVYLQITDIAGNYRTWTIGRDGKIKNVTETTIANAVTINNDGIHPYALVKDVKAPVTGLSGVTAGAYYNSTQTVHATIDEFNFAYLQRFDGSRAILHITKYEGNAGRAMSTYEVPASSFTGSGSNWSWDEIFDSDGHYVVEASFSDFATNPSNVSRIEEFTIDKTAPVITIEFDNNDVRNGKYYNATRTATITVTEHNFDPSSINIETTGAIGGWSSNGDTHTCTVFFDEGASHTLTVSGVDLAGNAAETVTEPEFVVDLTAPEIEFGGIAQRLGFTGSEDEYNSTLQPDSAYNGVVAPNITFKDEQNFDTSGTQFTLVGNKVGDVSDAYDHAESFETNSETVQFDDFGLKNTDTKYDVNADDVYTINAHMTDLAGNEAEGTITFSVNRFGSNYVVTVEEAGRQVNLAANPILDDAPTITVREINVSGAKAEANHSVVKEYANATTEIERKDSGNDEGYRLDTLDRRNTAHGWAEYVYTIRSANFGKDSSSDNGDGGQGTYRVNVASDDTASNVNTTADYWSSDSTRRRASAKVGTAEFTLDEVGPIIDETTLPGLIAPGREYKASFHVTDAITQGNDVEVLVDGKKVSVTHEGQEVADGERVGEGTFEFTIPARSFASRKVQIKVTDYADRFDLKGGGGFFVTTLIPEIGAVVAVLGAIGGGIAYTRKKNSDESEGLYNEDSLLH